MAKTQTKQEEPQTQQPQQETRQESLPVLAKPRLPWHPAIEERFGIDKSGWKALTEAIFPGAQTTEAVVLALSYCKARKLDPFKRCVHIVPIWDKVKRCYIDTVWPGIGELRTTAHRTKDYAGRDKTEFGPMIEKTWEGQDEKKGSYKVTVTFPEWAQVTVYRMLKGQRVAYAGPQVFWLETYGDDRNGTPNSMWQKRPRGQIDKCSEAAALRAAFPEEVGNEYTDDEAHLTKQVESREVEKAEAGNEGLKKLLAERGQKANGNGNAEAPQAEPDAPAETEQPEPKPAEERDEQTEAKVAEQKQKLAVSASKNNGGKKSNLF